MKILRLLRQESVQLLLLALPFALAAAWWNKLPPTVVTHWNLHGQPNGWMPKGPGLLLAPALNVALCLLFAFLPQLDPRLRRDPSTGTIRYRQILRWCRWAVTAFISVLSLTIIAIAAGWSIDVARLASTGTLLVLAVIGNFMGNLQPNYLIGIRTPWTLEDAATWRATHRLDGRAMVFGSLTLLLVGCFVSSAVLTTLLIVFCVGLGVWSLGYSAWFYQRMRHA